MKHVNSEQKSRAKISISSKHFGSPNRFRQSSLKSKLERSHRWRIFLSDDEDFRRFLELPCKKMVYNFDSMRLRLNQKKFFDKWKATVEINSSSFENNFSGETYTYSEQVEKGSATNHYYDQEFMWEDPSFNPYEEDEEEKLPSYEEVQEENLSENGEIFYAADGRPLDVDELHTFQPEDINTNTELQSSKAIEIAPSHHLNGMQRPRFNFDSTLSTEKVDSTLPFVATSSQGPNNDDFSNRGKSLQLDTSMSSTGMTNRPSFSIESLLQQSRSLPPTFQSNSHMSRNISTTLQLPQTYDSHQSLLPLKQPSWQSSSNIDDDRDLDEGFELPP